jgi:GMP synthase (glutamine-hydrolysing)
MGGPMGVKDESLFPWLVDEKRYIENALNCNKTVIGVCLGAQLLAEVLGARVYRNRHAEIGWFPIERINPVPCAATFDVIPDGLPVLHWHGDTYDLPRGAVHLARSRGCENQLFVHDDRRIGMQFHLEMRRGDAENLVTHCGHELVGGPFVQRREEILAPCAPFETTHAVLADLLDGLAQSTHSA